MVSSGRLRPSRPDHWTQTKQVEFRAKGISASGRKRTCRWSRKTKREGGGFPPGRCGRLRHNAFDKTNVSGEMSFANMETSIRHIPTRTRRQVMDWSLVLASQGIETTIE